MNYFCKNNVKLRHSNPDFIEDIVDELNVNQAKDGRKSQWFNLIEPNPFPDEDSEQCFDWKIEHWGSTSEAEVIDYFYDADNDPYSVEITFYTEFSPPIDLYDYMSSEGWTVIAMFSEPDAQFVGLYRDQESIYYEFDFSKGDDCLDHIPKELIAFGELKREYSIYLRDKETDFDEDQLDDSDG